MSSDSADPVPATPVKSTSSLTSDIGYPNGHLGHLTESQTKALQEFKALILEKGYYQPGPPPSHDDPLLL